MLTLTVADSGTGNQAQASVGGVDAGGAVAVYGLRTGRADAAWTLAASRSGPGPLTLLVEAGTYWFHAAGPVNGVPSLSPVLIESVSAVGGFGSPHYAALVDMAERIAELNLPKIGQNVAVRKFPEPAASFDMPCCLVSPFDIDRFELMDTCAGVAFHSLTVSFWDSDGSDDQSTLSRWLYWRYAVAQEFISVAALGVPGFHRLSFANPTPAVEERLPDYMLLRSILFMTAKISYPRS